VVLRLLRGTPPEVLARELGLDIQLLQTWRARALAGIDSALRIRGGDPLQRELEKVGQSLRELRMENELLRVRCREFDPLASRRSRP
jgi:hypothetical protein